MYCKRCGSNLNENLMCSACGFQNTLEAGIEIDTYKASVEENQKIETQVNRNKLWAWLSGIMFCLSFIPLYKGYDKITNYYSSDTHYSLNVNAYVGGDAYNYIINAGQATAFFVLTIGAALLGVGFLIVYYLSDKKVN